MIRRLLINLGFGEYNPRERVDNFKAAHRIVRVISGNFAIESNGEDGWTLGNKRYDTYSEAKAGLYELQFDFLDNVVVERY